VSNVRRAILSPTVALSVIVRITVHVAHAQMVTFAPKKAQSRRRDASPVILLALATQSVSNAVLALMQMAHNFSNAQLLFARTIVSSALVGLCVRVQAPLNQSNAELGS